MHDLLEIQRAQFTDRAGAEARLLAFVRRELGLDATAVELRPLAVSLNSFNGFLTLAGGRRLFFKTHTEPDPVVSEFYNCRALSEAGYPVLRPVHSSVEAGRQFLVYELVEDPSVFEVAERIEAGAAELAPALRRAQAAADRQLAGIYRATLRWQPAAEAAAAPVHQLFFHRLAGRRLREGYGEDVPVALPGLEPRMGQLRELRWCVNGQWYAQSLADLIAEGRRLLRPAQAGPSVVGHGDAHNGNVFLRRDGGGLTYFDPAFGGRHDPLLDLAKPLFHNTFASWLYQPEQAAKQLTVRVRLERDRLHVEHDHRPHPVRREFLASKLDHTLRPLVCDLRARGWLVPHWRRRLKAALFCCPLLTKVLTDRAAFPPEITLLGLAYAIEMGAESNGVRSLLDRSLDQLAAAEPSSAAPASRR